MRLWVENHFFVSISLNKKECLSFDNTSRAIEWLSKFWSKRRSFPKIRNLFQEMIKSLDLEKYEGENVTTFENRVLEEVYKNIDLDKRDWINDEVWEAAWKKPISQGLTNKLPFCSQLISDNFRQLDEYKKEMGEFGEMLKVRIKKFD